MKRTILSLIALLALAVSFAAVAGKGGPTIEGIWAGGGKAMYVDGTPARIIEVSAELFQDGNFFYGFAQFKVIIGDADEPITQLGQLSGYISGNAIKGVLGGCFDAPPDCLGAGILDGKLSGNLLRGTVVDFSDGSTSVVRMHRLRD